MANERIANGFAPRPAGAPRKVDTSQTEARKRAVRRAQAATRTKGRKEVIEASRALARGDEAPLVVLFRSKNKQAIKTFSSLAKGQAALDGESEDSVFARAAETVLATFSKNSAHKKVWVAAMDAASGGKISSDSWLRSAVDPGYVRLIRFRRNAGLISFEFMLVKYVSVNVPHVRTAPEVQLVLLEFFKRNTFIFSGAKRDTRNLTVQRYVLFARLHGMWPAMLRALSKSEFKPPEGTKMWKGMAMAIKMELAPGFDSQVEYKNREKEYLRHWEWSLAKSRVRRRRPLCLAGPNDTAEVTTRERPQMEVDANIVDLEMKGFVLDPVKLTPPIPPSPPTFWSVLEQLKCTFTCCHTETRCHLHDNGPVWKLRKNNVVKQMAEQGVSEEKSADLQRELTALGKLIAHYDMHIQQYKKQRAFLKQLERLLPVGHCIVYRDFVNMYAQTAGKDGNQLKNLVLVMLWRDKPGQELNVRKLSNLCSDSASQSCDAYYVADVFDFHMRPKDEFHSGILSGFKKIYLGHSTQH
jgi:hypothetical protein